MPKIEIETCSKTPNYCALEAVSKSMLNNLTKRNIRDYQHESIIQVKSGRVLKVTETPMDINNELILDCKFKVESVEE